MEIQNDVAAEEGARYDHGEIEAGNREFIDQAKVIRKRHRKNKDFAELDHDSDVDDDFKKEFMAAANKHGYKRKKKHMFNEDGVAMEPFHIRNDIRDGLLTQEGYIKTSLRDFDQKQAR